MHVIGCSEYVDIFLLIFMCKNGKYYDKGDNSKGLTHSLHGGSFMFVPEYMTFSRIAEQWPMSLELGENLKQS